MLAFLLAVVLPIQAAVVRVAPQGRGPATVNFNVTPMQVLDRYVAAQTKFESALKGVLELPAGQRDFANTVKALEAADAQFSEEIQHLIFLAYVSPDAELKTAAQMVEEDASKLNVAVWSRDDVYQAIKTVADSRPELPAEDARLLERVMTGFKHTGMGLAPEERSKLKELRERLSTLENKFSNNLNETFPGLELDREQLAGLPDDYVAGLERTPEGKHKVTLSYPDYLPFMRYAKDSELRRQLQLKYNTRAAEENGPLLVEALRLRREVARALGYESYPEMALQGRMAGTPEKVWAFLQRLWPMVAQKGRAELDDLLAEKRKEQPQAERLETWEQSYYANKLRQARYGYDPEEVKKYFPVGRVIDGTMKVYQQLLGVTFTPVDEPTYHPDVKLFAVSDTATGRAIGHFYLDLHPREGKYGHAAAFTLVQGRELPSGRYRETVSAMVANFPKPTPGKPALLPHDDVETFFHEFGHIMHQVLTRARYATFAGSSVALDFVEAPSQMLENFAWDRRVLDLISGHYEDPSRKLPQDLFERMVAAKNFNNAIMNLSQIAFSMADMSLHAVAPLDTSALFNMFMELIGLSRPQRGAKPDASFGHLMGGYGAGYYSYLWSQVYAYDIFSIFAEAGVLSPEVGLRYRRTILEKGSSQPEMDTLREFLQREPSEKPFLDQLGAPSA